MKTKEKTKRDRTKEINVSKRQDRKIIYRGKLKLMLVLVLDLLYEHRGQLAKLMNRIMRILVLYYICKR